MKALHSRVNALEASRAGGFQPHCWVEAEGDETSDQAIERHKLTEGCIENSGGHIVWID